jgi:hypothetical protein
MKEHRLLKEHINRIRARYQGVGRRRILRDLGKDYGRSRKYLTRLLNQKSTVAVNKNAGRPREYDDTDIWWLQTLWVQMGTMSSKHMKIALPEWLPFFEDPSMPEDVKKKILRMSPTTMDRLLSDYKKSYDRKLRSTTRAPRAKGIMALVPQRALGGGNKSDKPGMMQADCVAHCGDRLWGRFAWTINMTDEVTGWTEQRATLDRLAEDVRAKIHEMKVCLPMRMWWCHTDNGSEFINEVMIKYFDNPNDQVNFTRGRAYKKNDQAHIEQKNFTHVRQIFGYDRIETQELVAMMNDIYSNEFSLLQNFFVPQMKLLSKVRVGSRYRKKFDKPKTPYHRLMNSKWLLTEQKDQLRATYQTINPFNLRKSLEKKLKNFFQRLQELKQKDIPTDQIPVKEAA